ncbi:hypothetical protein LAUMK13_05725 [Mycobacterium innocens]|uniref:Uncharacterized protein n=1 Tax=Mycobacterium innocens TaxID=2341083 RepID=A0A498QLA8_9MYCO|nr:hypothetical protein LAUMK13_05725 [Mycobacterium innocens]
MCEACRTRAREKKNCAVCARAAAVHTTLPLGPVCGPCYLQIRRSPRVCAGCGQRRPLVGVRDGHGEVCGPCSGDTRNWICQGCGRVDLLIGGSHCLACTVAARVRHVLTGPDGQIPAQLGGVARLLLEANAPEVTQEILNGSQWIQLLGELVASGEPITHEVLDELGPNAHARHLREVLVRTGALDERVDGLETLEHWVKNLCADLSPGRAAVLRPYASWSVLARARRRGSQRPMTTSAYTSMQKYARTRITVANQFLNWLEHNQIALSQATQHDVDRWLGQGATPRRRLRDFLRWAYARGLAPDLEVPWLGREGLPEHVLDDDERWALLRRCLRDDSLPLRLRVAGALVLLYGQIPSRIVEPPSTASPQADQTPT